MNAGKILVTSYQDPDLDGFACAFAYTEFLARQGKLGVLGISGTLHTEAQFLVNKYQIDYQPQDQNPAQFGQIILVDASDLDGIDSRIHPASVVELIDHRKVNQAELFENARVQIEPVGAAATLIAEKFMEAKTPISPSSAVLLYGAIISNTLNFQARVTTQRDRNAADWLAVLINPGDNFVRDLFKAKSDISEANLVERLEHDFATFDFGKRVGIAQLEVLDAGPVISQLRDQILNQLSALEKQEKLDYIFLTVIDLNNYQNIFVARSEATELLSAVLGVSFQNNIALRRGFIMRKEITPLIKQRLVNRP